MKYSVSMINEEKNKKVTSGFTIMLIPTRKSLILTFSKGIMK